mgnify:CR=1 FL=1
MNVQINDPAKTYTLEDFISMRYSDDITFRNFSILEVIDNVEYLDHNVIDDYLDELDSICINCPLDLDQQKKYRYAPDILAYDVYGSTQLDFVILAANGIMDPKEFVPKTIKLPYASALKNFLSEVYNSESGYIEQNRSDNGLKIY